MMFFKWWRVPTALAETFTDSPTSMETLEQIEKLISLTVAGDYKAIQQDDSEAGQLLRPLAAHFHDHRFEMLRNIVDIWVEQTAPLFAVAQMKGDMKELGARTQAVASATDELVASIAEIGRTTEGVAQDAAVVRERVAGGVAAADRAVSQMAAVSGSVADLATKVVHLNGATDQIAAIVKTIEKIASQTNLLALNATIEASRAGEAGKGFAVVAGEVKTLANQTAKATDDIRDRIATLQAGMSDILKAMALSGQSVDDGSQAVGEAVETISKISHDVDEVTGKMTQIAGIVQQQSAATSEVASSIAGTAGMSDHALLTIEELSNAVEQVSKVVQPQLQALGKDPDDHMLVQLARSDHSSFKKRVIDTIVGRGNAHDHDLPDHHTCRFGKWYDNISDATVRQSAAYAGIAEPHLKVHAHGKEALSFFHNGHFNSAIEAAGKMEEASHEVFQSLHDIARLLKETRRQP